MDAALVIFVRLIGLSVLSLPVARQPRRCAAAEAARGSAFAAGSGTSRDALAWRADTIELIRTPETSAAASGHVAVIDQSTHENHGPWLVGIGVGWIAEWITPAHAPRARLKSSPREYVTSTHIDITHTGT